MSLRGEGSSSQVEVLALARNMESSSVITEEKEYKGTGVGRSGDMTVEAHGTSFLSPSVFSVK